MVAVRYWLVMPAAGASRRFGTAQSKLERSLAGRTVLDLALEPFMDDERCRGIALALNPDGLANAEVRARLGRKVLPIAGGERRCDSVLAGLAALSMAEADDWVLVHDAARPCLSAADLAALLAAGAQHAVGALLAEPVADTLKRADGASAIDATVDRRGLWRALTPQMFRYGALRAALQAAVAAGREPTDEAQCMEWQGARPLLVAGEDANIKITSPKDLELAAAILATRAAAASPGEGMGARSCA
ncbi:MAG TPA: 2-C-methyl-D-erythritol 4-phosphate cytidylyltransferase [Burkholderiaceae bacterium]|nr:2-C-methyl-D-erythritol 4-phosphate cytidylyltransferase [Burkholderiaceae bacterium]